MTLDIIIPSLNESKNLKVLLPYLAQNRNNKTGIIVVDGCKSTDNTVDICRQHDVTYIKSDVCQRSAQMNLGVSSSEADVILFVHADVKPPVGFYNLIKSEIVKGNSGGMFAYRFDSRSLLLRINAYFTRFDGLFAGGGDQCLFVERQIFNDLGKFDDDYVIMEDFDFWRRIKNSKTPYAIIKERATVSARKYDNNSYLRVNILNLVSFLRFRLNVPAGEIRNSYQKWLN